LKNADKNIIYDTCNTLSVYDLSRAGCFNGGSTDFVASWEVEDEPCRTLLQVKAAGDGLYIAASHIRETQHITYHIHLIAVPSCLGNGALWFFECPVTGVHCRKLLFHNGYLQHRSAVKGLYQAQTHTPCIRKFMGDIKAVQTICKISEKVNAPWFRQTYACAPAKSYIKMLRQLREYEQRIGALHCT